LFNIKNVIRRGKSRGDIATGTENQMKGTEDLMKLATSIGRQVSLRGLSGFAVACALLLGASTVQAAPLTATPPGFLAPVPVEAGDPPGGATVVEAGVPVPFAGLGFSGMLVSSVYRGNQYGDDALTFTYQLSNDASSANVLHRLTVSSFETFLTDVSIQSAGSAPSNIAPTLADRSTADVVGFSFLENFGQGPIPAGGQSALLVIETNSTVYTASTASIIDGTTANATTWAPLQAIPEPGTWALGIIGLMGLAGMVRRNRR
jgi:hypothetical protein